MTSKPATIAIDPHDGRAAPQDRLRSPEGKPLTSFSEDDVRNSVAKGVMSDDEIMEIVTLGKPRAIVHVLAIEDDTVVLRIGRLLCWRSRTGPTARRNVRYEEIDGDGDIAHTTSFLPHPKRAMNVDVKILNVTIHPDEETIKPMVCKRWPLQKTHSDAPIIDQPPPRSRSHTPYAPPYRQQSVEAVQSNDHARRGDVDPHDLDLEPLQANVAAEPEDRESNAGDDETTPEDVADDMAQLLAETYFHEDQIESAPGLVPRTGRELVDMIGQAATVTAPRLTFAGLAPTTRKAHLLAIRKLTDLPAMYERLSMTTALVTWMTNQARQRNWAATTLAKNMATLQGALRALPVYYRLQPLMLSDDEIWRAAMMAAQKSAKEHDVRTPKAATYEVVCRAIQSEPRLQVKTLILLSWLSCARVGDTLQLMTTDVVISENGQLNNNNFNVSVTYKRGKTIRARGPYTVHMSCPRRWWDMMHRWISTRHTWLFPREMTTQDVLISLRRVSAALECRSLRRGALQTLAAAGVPESTLLHFSGHTSSTTLRRYLQWGLYGLARREEMTDAAKALFTDSGRE